DFHAQAALFEIDAVDIGDLVFAAGGGLEFAGDIHYAVVIKIEAGHRVVGFRMRGLLHDFQRAHLVVKGDDAIALGIGHRVREDHSAIGIAAIGEKIRHLCTVKDIVAQNQTGGVGTDKIGADDKG